MLINPFLDFFISPRVFPLFKSKVNLQENSLFVNIYPEIPDPAAGLATLPAPHEILVDSLNRL
jgi:hypothetical protein